MKWKFLFLSGREFVVKHVGGETGKGSFVQLKGHIWGSPTPTNKELYHQRVQGMVFGWFSVL
jgi:hypothetical protein